MQVIVIELDVSLYDLDQWRPAPGVVACMRIYILGCTRWQSLEVQIKLTLAGHAGSSPLLVGFLRTKVRATKFLFHQHRISCDHNPMSNESC